jgi:chemotaxis protein CheD
MNVPSPRDAGDKPVRSRFFDPVSGTWMVKVRPGDYHVARDFSETIVTTLGSCVSACIRDPLVGIGGMNHFMLPEDNAGRWGGESASTRFGNFAMEKLVNELLKRGCARERLEVKIFGGGNVIESQQAVGTKNAEFALRYLQDEDLKCAARDLGGDFPRRIHFFPSTGRVIRRILGRTDAVSVVRDETNYAANLRRQAPRSDDIELFGERS